MNDSIKILHLYPSRLNEYGDGGNLLVLIKRMTWRGFKPEVIKYEIGDNLDFIPDIVIAGCGPEAGLTEIQTDFLKITSKIQAWIDAGVPILLVGDLYHLLGQYLKTSTEGEIAGTKILDLYTVTRPKRQTGNLVLLSESFGEIVGYENCATLTKISDDLQPLGQIIKGRDHKSKTEGILYKNLIGTDIHGPLLSKNPKIADFMIKQALQKKLGKDFELPLLDDAIENQAHAQAGLRPR